jgi:hypothetical protein
MMLPPTQLRDGRTYGSENLRSAMQKDFFDSIDPERKLSGAACMKNVLMVTVRLSLI